MNKSLLFIALLLCFSVHTVLAQSPFDHKRVYTREATPSDNPTDIFSIGIGVGQEYGGIGVNASVYPQKNIGIFAGAGTALAGFGYNVGLKGRLLPHDGQSKVHPYLVAMYGYTAAVRVSGASDLNKIWYGPSFGLGMDLVTGSRNTGYFTLAILVPVRSSDVHDYIEYLKDNGVDIHQLSPVTFSFGYKFVII